MEERKKFRLADVVLSVICVVFVAEAAAPVASIGNSQYFWWVFMMIAFLLPYGMISSELGTTYTGDGGLYDWINKAFPRSKWGARASWYYWINFPLWMASLAVVCPELLGVLTGLQFGWLAKLLIELAFIWIVTWIAFYPVCDSILILNISAAIKMLLALTVGVLGIVYVARSGFVNDMAPRTFLPGFDLHSLSYISVIIFNFLGFEVVCTYADNMRDPKRQIPQAIVESVFSITDNSFLILLLINLILLFVGMIVNDTTGIILVAPLLLPLAKAIGLDPIQYAAIFGVNLAVGSLTPPYASLLYLGIRIGKVDFVEILPYVGLFLLGYVPVMLLTTYWPDVSLFIPRLFGFI